MSKQAKKTLHIILCIKKHQIVDQKVVAKFYKLIKNQTQI